MLTALPPRVMNYRVTVASPTVELITLGQILAEVGDCASTILDREHLSLTRKCATKLKKVVSELTSRHCIESEEDLYEIHEGEPASGDIRSMTITDLYRLYRQWPIRLDACRRSCCEPYNYSLESDIVRELQRRIPATKDEQLKIDYCTATYAAAHAIGSTLASSTTGYPAPLA